MNGITKYLFLLLILSIPIVLVAQDEKIKFGATVVDIKTKQPIPYATVFNATQQFGTTSNSDGFFELNGINKGDIIIISLVGYKTEKITLNKSKVNSQVLLSAQGLTLNEVKINTGNPYLYKIIKELRNNRPRKEITAKSYFNLSSSIDSDQVEFVEGYYNSELNGLDINSLQAKQIRFALKKNNNSYFISPHTSRAFSMHNLFQTNDFYPRNPLELNKRRLKKYYNLFLYGQYENDSGDSIYVIDFVPIKDTSQSFSGKFWINMSSMTLVKLNLEIYNASIYPFRAFIGDKMTDVHMQIEKTFQDNNLLSVALNYNFRYVPGLRTKKTIRTKKLRSPYRVDTKSFVYLYNLKEQFDLPFFDYSYKVSHRDYGQASAYPYNPIFWSRMSEFRYEKESANKYFIDKIATLNSANIELTGLNDKPTALIAPNYIPWSNQFRIKVLPDTIHKGQPTFINDQFGIEGQIYLDANKFNDTNHVITATYLDPFNTFYNLPLNNSVQAFANIYFDLLEIQRRQLNASITAKGSDKKTLNKLFLASQNSIDSLSNIYFKETQRGTNYEALAKWNEYVWKELAIDNLILFEVKPTD